MWFRSIWNAIRRVDEPKSQDFYSEIRNLREVVHGQTEALKAHDERMGAAIDEQTKKINQIFDDLSRSDENP